jgi:hypothetical protein
MDSHTYTRELLEKYLLSELKEIAQCFSLIPEGNKTRRETWISALVGMPFPAIRLIDYQPREATEKLPGAEADPVREPLMEATEKLPGAEADPVREPLMEATEKLLGAGADPVQEPLMEATEKSLDVDPVQEPSKFPDLESALAEIARLRTENEELLSRVRSQSRIISEAKDISPILKPNLRRIRVLAASAFLTVAKDVKSGWLLTWGTAKRHFKRLKEIWDILILDDWPLTDIFSPLPPSPPSPQAAKPLFAPIYSRYSAIPFCDDDLIDLWSLGVNVASSGRSPPAGGEAM